MTSGDGGVRPVALITGAAGGIGGGIARQLSLAGFDLVLSDRIESHVLHGVADQIRQAGGTAEILAQDLCDTSTLDKFVACAQRVHGRLDCLVNNAGVSVLSRGDILDVSTESFDRCIEVNLRATFFLTQRIARVWMGEQSVASSPRRRRSIITITSVSADMVGSVLAEYCISKAGLSSMVKQFAARLAREGIDCFEIRPGMIATSMTDSSQAKYDGLIASGFVPAGRWGETDEIGKAVSLLATGAISYTVGQVLNIDGGMSLRVF